MKKMIFLVVAALLSLSVYCQQIDTIPQLTQQDYIKKSKHQKTAAWVLTAAGAGGLMGTLIADVSQAAGGVFITVISLGTIEPEYKSYTGAYVLSAAALAGGIVLFTTSAKNKRKAQAMSVSLKMETSPVLQQLIIINYSYPSVGVKIRL